MSAKDEEKLGCLVFIMLGVVIAIACKQIWLAITIILYVLINSAIKYIQNGKRERNLDVNIKAEPYNAKLYNERTDFYIKRKEYRKALEDCNRVLELNACNPAESFAIRAYVYYSLKNYQHSIKDYNDAITYQPQCATLYYYRALAYIGSGSIDAYKEAIIDLNTAYELKYNTGNPKQYTKLTFGKVDIHYQRGILYSWLNKPACALEELKKVPPKYHSRNLAEQEIIKCNEKIKPIKENERLKQLDYWQNLNGWEYEGAVANVFKKLGYNTTVTKGSGDGGIDIIIERSGYIGIVQCKHYTYPVPPEPVRALWGCKDEFGANEVILVASNGVTQSGQEFIDKRPDFKLYTLNDIMNLISNADKSYADFISEIRWYSKQPPQNKPNLDINIQFKVDNTFADSNVAIKYSLWERDKEDNYITKENKLSVKIPSYFKYGAKLKCAKEGNVDLESNSIGDLYLILSEESNILKNSTENDEFYKIDKELRKFNWAAFILPVLWLPINGGQDILGLAILTGIILNILYAKGLSEIVGGILYACLIIYLGIKGNRLAWNHCKYNDIKFFKKVQKDLLIISLIIIFILSILIVLCRIK